MSYRDEHKVWLWGFLKHIGPYLGAIGAAIVVLVESGWIDTPARSQEIQALQKSLQAQGETIRQLSDTQRQMRDNDIRQTQQLEGVNDKLDSIDNSLDAVTRALLGNRADRLHYERGDPPL